MPATTPTCKAIDVSRVGNERPRFDPCPACGERERSCPHRTILLPNAKQIPFLDSRAFEAMYGGGKGSGKTRALILAPLYFVHEPRFRGLLLRREWPQAERTLLAEARKVYPLLGARWTGRKAWVFPSGAEIEINGCDNEADVERYFGIPDLSFLGIDQLEHFTRAMYLGLLSCMRTATGLPLIVRATANPGGLGHDWLIERFAAWIHEQARGTEWEDQDYKGPLAPSGGVLWYRTTSGEQGIEAVCARDAHEPDCLNERRRLEAVSAAPPCEPGKPCPLHRPRSRQYVHAKVSDNPYTAGTEVERNLLGLDPVERAWYLGGIWLMRAKPGSYFKREWLAPALNVPPGTIICRLRYWDRAATSAKDANSRSAWTAGVKLAMTSTGLILVEDVHRGQWDPGQVDAEILSTADADGPHCVICIEEDGGQAGKAQAYYDTRMLAGRIFKHCPPIKDKVTRMRPASSLAQKRGIALMRGAWNEAFLRELEGCPGGLWDQIDSLSGGFVQLLHLQEELVQLARAQARREAQGRPREQQLAADGAPRHRARLGW